jgi:hypothetical protein
MKTQVAIHNPGVVDYSQLTNAGYIMKVKPDGSVTITSPRQLKYYEQEALMLKFAKQLITFEDVM